MLTGGGRKNVSTEEAVPGGGQRACHGQCGLKRRDSAKEEVDNDDTVFAIDKAEEREEKDKQPNVLRCGSTGGRGVKLTESENCSLLVGKKRKDKGGATR